MVTEIYAGFVEGGVVLMYFRLSCALPATAVLDFLSDAGTGNVDDTRDQEAKRHVQLQIASAAYAAGCGSRS